MSGHEYQDDGSNGYSRRGYYRSGYESNNGSILGSRNGSYHHKEDYYESQYEDSRRYYSRSRGSKPSQAQSSHLHKDYYVPEKFVSKSERFKTLPSGPRLPKKLTFGEEWEKLKTEYESQIDVDTNGENQLHEMNPYDFTPKHPGKLLIKKANYKVTYDPELHKEAAKGSQIVYRFSGQGVHIVKDPRGSIKQNYVKYCLSRKSKKTQYKGLLTPKFQYDKNSIGDPPDSEVVVWNFPSNFGSKIIKSNFSKYGSIETIEMIMDPISATPLGVCRIKYDDNDGKEYSLAHKNAVAAVEGAHGKLAFENNYVKVGLNTKKNCLLEERKKLAIKHFQDRKKHQQKAREILLAKQKEKEEAERKIQIEKRTRELEAERKRNLKIQLKLTKAYGQSNRNIGSLGVGENPLAVDFFQQSITNLRKKDEPVEIKLQIPESVIGVINHRPFLFFADKYFPTNVYQSRTLKQRLAKYDWIKILSEPGLGFFIVFNSKKAAVKCYNDQNGKYFHKGKGYFKLCLDGSSYGQKDKEKSNPVDQAVNQIIKELENTFRKDIKERIIGPAVVKLLDPKNFPSLQEENEKLKEETPKPEQKTDIDDIFAIGNAMPQLILPSFRKKNSDIKKKRKVTSEGKSSKKLNKYIPMNRILDDDDQSAVSESVEDEDLLGHPNKKQKAEFNKALAFYPSSEEEEEEEDEKLIPSFKESAEPEPVLQPTPPETEEEAAEDELAACGPKYRPETGFPKIVYPEVFIPDELSLDVLKRLVRDDEDLELMMEVFANVEPAKEIQNTNYWCWRKAQKDIQAPEEVAEAVEYSNKALESLENHTGSFKSEGYRKIPDSLKSEYLLHRRKVHRHEPLNTIKNEGDGTSIQSSRVNRAQNRRLAADTKQILGTEIDILKLNSLNKRRKPVNFARSAIHNWGLYALEPIAANEMIIEYVGDSIRQQVAELRENKYLKSGIGSSYLFRIDENSVIDATKKGGIARFINHCCNPSCTAKIIKVDGKKRIVIYALKDIKANEELTYDYKFERETNDEERIQCLCGAPGCKGFLN